jgi:hypothetical protein
MINVKIHEVFEFSSITSGLRPKLSSYQFLVELKTVHIQWTQPFPVVALENFISNLTLLCLTRSFNGFTHDIQIRSIYTSYCSLICIFFPLFNMLYFSIDGSNVYENDEIVYSFDCHYFDLHRELFQASFSPMKHSKAF